MGLEPTTAGTTIRSSTSELYSPSLVAAASPRVLQSGSSRNLRSPACGGVNLRLRAHYTAGQVAWQAFFCAKGVFFATGVGLLSCFSMFFALEYGHEQADAASFRRSRCRGARFLRELQLQFV